MEFDEPCQVSVHRCWLFVHSSSSSSSPERGTEETTEDPGKGALESPRSPRQAVRRGKETSWFRTGTDGNWGKAGYMTTGGEG